MEQQGRRAIGRVCPRGAESYTWQEGDTAERIARTYATTYNITTGCLLLALSIGIIFCIRIVEYLNLLPYHQRISVGYNNIIANVWTG